ncbi:MAG: hypothetical protein VKL39_01585 [Leptolyngbyaceae bacterium]|nr:hypothetical protein [Leptolyngbyaceae bacterium]
MNPITIGFAVIVAIVLFLVWRDSQTVDGLDANLVRAVRGDKALARRLLQQARLKYPGKSDRWYVEKVIYDAQRDQGVIKARHNPLSVDFRDLREKLFVAGAALWVFNSLISTIDRLFRR